MIPRLTFLMPSHSKDPAGGFKVVYEYANRFVADGYEVNIIYPATVFFKDENFVGKIKSVLRYFVYKVTKHYTPYRWFNLDRRINTYWIPSLCQRFIPKSDILIATAAVTAECLDKFLFSGKKIYFIQGYEVWWKGEEYFLNTLNLALDKIVISPHLLKIVESYKQDAQLILNGFDFNYFKKTIDFKDRNKYQTAMLFHLSPAKGCQEGIKALEIVKVQFPMLEASLFGHPERPKNLPNWIMYYQSPNKEMHNRIYNKSAIFIGTSHSEGWGLTIGEAMICGAAVVCTDIDGYKIMAQSDETALLSEPKDYKAMATNIIRLIENDKLRDHIAQNGHNNIQKYKWDESYHIFKEIVKIK